MAKGGRGFAATVERWARKSETMMERFAQEFLIALAREALVETPVVSGQLRGGWHITRAGTNTAFDPVFDKSGLATFDRLGKEGKQIELGQVALVLNAAPHAPFIEYGTTTIEPRAMLRKAAARAPEIMDYVGRNLGLRVR